MRSWGPVDLSKDGHLIARKARVLYADGKLYLATSSKAVTWVESPEPVESAGRWTAGAWSWRKVGCPCSWGLGRISSTALIERAEAG